MTAYFDATLEAPPIVEQNTDPIIPEERHVFELVGFERSEPDQWRKEGGVKWTWRVFKEDGRTPFLFQDEPYEFWRTTGLDRSGRPSFNVGTYANEWASALLGRSLGVNDHFQISELRGKRFSAMVVWEKQRADPTKKTIKLASLRHVPVSTPNGAAQVSATPTDAEIDRATVIADLQKAVKTLSRLDAAQGKAAATALADTPLDTADLDDMRRLLADFQQAIDTALDG